jgi:hypothetical protein
MLEDNISSSIISIRVHSREKRKWKHKKNKAPNKNRKGSRNKLDLWIVSNDIAYRTKKEKKKKFEGCPL